MAHDLYIDTPVINSIDDSNKKHINHVISMIEKVGNKNIGVLGLSFKAGTDDMRNSPIVNVIEALKGKGYNIRIYDKNVSVSRLVGKNKSVIMQKLPHLNAMLHDDLQELVAWSDVLVLSNKSEEFKSLKLKKNQTLIDLVRIKELENSDNYNGLCW